MTMPTAAAYEQLKAERDAFKEALAVTMGVLQSYLDLRKSAERAQWALDKARAVEREGGA